MDDRRSGPPGDAVRQGFTEPAGHARWRSARGGARSAVRLPGRMGTAGAAARGTGGGGRSPRPRFRPEPVAVRHSGGARSGAAARRGRRRAGLAFPRLPPIAAVSCRQAGSAHDSRLPRARTCCRVVHTEIAGATAMDTLTTGFAFDIERLLSPISASEPAGQSLRYEGTYDLIAGLRREDDPTLDQGVWTVEPKRADWAAVAQTCLLAIETRSKDIQLAA